MEYVLITPARNEEANLERTVRSVVAQTVLPLRWVIVNDGSTDGTSAIIERYTKQYSWIHRVDMPAHRLRSFSEKARCFNEGYKSVSELRFDVIGNLDADLSFEPDYLQFLLEKFAEMPDLGVAGTVFREDGYDSAVDSFEGERHVAGGCQLFRRDCLAQVGGYVPNPAGGVDWIAVTTARMRGWRTRSFREKFFFHHRPLGTAERGGLSSAFSYGEKDYYLGNHPVWQALRVCYRSTKRPFVVASLALAAGYVWAAVRRIPRPASPELVQFHRREQMEKLRRIVSSVVRLRRVDKFNLVSQIQASAPAASNQGPSGDHGQ
jgi:glycosyltransferase involved in cell wall biosynthesis